VKRLTITIPNTSVQLKLNLTGSCLDEDYSVFLPASIPINSLDVPKL